MTRSSRIPLLTQVNDTVSGGHWLPVWARPAHPVVVRRLAALPAFGGYIHGLHRRRLIGVLMLLLAPCALLTGSLPLQLILLPLSWAPLLWAAPLLSQERQHGTWDLLRLTPYARADLLLANGAGVAYGLRRVMRWLVIGQGVCVLNCLLSLVLVFGSGGYRTLAGEYIHLADVPPAAGMLPAFVGIALLSLLAVPLDFGLSIGLGVLASALVTRREAALLLAAGLRIAFSVVVLGAGVVGLTILTGQSPSPLMLFGALLVGGPFGWPLLGVLQAPGAALVITLVTVGFVLLLLAATFGTIRGVARRL